MRGKERFTIVINSSEKSNLIYKDLSCEVYCNVADFRDNVYWTILLKAEKDGEKIGLTVKQKEEVYRRINYLSMKKSNKQVYVDELGFIEEPPYDLETLLLEIE
ncbi:hypothetical protein [Enterococcus sp. LJL51]|uniref:hypothetical protein n=1 Tax=Enterococcus sp. LJL51 TaxID=3416656 RepID=UPI003CEA7D6E